MKLSIIVPGIRPGNWKRLYDSIGEAFHGEFELIIISPYKLPVELEGMHNIKLIFDLGTPVRCMQIGLEQCQGDYVSWAADDGYYMPNSIDVAFKSLEGVTDERTYVIGKYQEGNESASCSMDTLGYYYINAHKGSRSRFIPNECLMVMVGLVPRKLLFEIGGWDASLFEVCPMAFLDLSIRMHNTCCPRIFQKERMFKCGHMPGHEGDHGPIHDAQIEHDEPLFRKIYHERESQNRNVIPLDNWKQSPPVWERRFGKGA